MALAPITEKQRKHVIDDINYDEDQMKKKVEQVKEWMKKQPHLPQIPDDFANKLLRLTLLGTKLSTERAKYKIDTYYAMRHQIPEILTNRDPLQEDVRYSVDIVRYFPLSELTPDGVRVHIMCYNLDKDKKFTGNDIKAFYKRVMAISDARVLQDDFCRGDYLISDVRGLQLSHITELPWLFFQKWTTLAQEGLPIRIKGVFIIHAHNYAETALKILKPCFKEKVRKRIHVFSGDHTNVYPYIPQRILPKDFGGESPSIAEQSRAWQKTLESMRDFLIEDDKRVTDESKRPRDSINDCGQLFGVNGTFNKLTID